MAPYCAIPRDYLSDTALLRAMGLLVSQHGQLGAIPPPPFLSVSPLESMRSGGAIPPPQKGYLSDTCAIPYENKANGCDTPLCDTISTGYCAIRGGISHWAAKFKPKDQQARVHPCPLRAGRGRRLNPKKGAPDPLGGRFGYFLCFLL